MASQRFSVSPGRFSICRLSPTKGVPSWAVDGEFVSVTRTLKELSIICPEAHVPDGVECVSGYSLMEIAGPFPLSAVGILHSFTEPLAAAGISILAIGTFDTDYLLLRSAEVERAVEVLLSFGHELRS